MSDDKKSLTPPYASYKSFINFINGLRENGCPSHITRTVLPGSNSGKAMLAATLRYLNLIDVNDKPTADLTQLIDSQANYSSKLSEILYKSYDFLTDPTLDLANTTTEKVVERFRAMGASGSTISKCMAFFLAAASDAKIEVSKYVKAPMPTASANGIKKKVRKKPDQDAEVDDGDDGDDGMDGNQNEIPDGMEKIVVPLRGMEDGIIYFPAELTLEEAKRAVKMAQLILNNFYGIEE